MSLSEAQRYRSLALQTNRQFAYAVIYGGMNREDAATFGVWVCREKLNRSAPADNIALYYAEGDSGSPL